MYCAKKYEIASLSAFCKKSLKTFNSAETVCQMMKFAQIYEDPEIVNICLEAVEDNMPTFLYSNSFLELCPKCVYEIAHFDRFLVTEDVLFNRVLKWSEEQCKSQNLPVTPENQRQVLGDILLGIRFPLMDHQYLEDVVCKSDVLSAEEKLDILRQQLKSKKESSGRFKFQERILRPKEKVMFNDCDPKETSNYRLYSIYSYKFTVSSYSILVGIYLNFKHYITHVRGRKPHYERWDGLQVIISVKPYFETSDYTDIADTEKGTLDMNKEKEFSTPLSEVNEENLLELYPRFFIPLSKGVVYSVSVRFGGHSYNYDDWQVTYYAIRTPHDTMSFNGKTLTTRSWSGRQLLKGLLLA
jgi:hypothetical protein